MKIGQIILLVSFFFWPVWWLAIAAILYPVLKLLARAFTSPVKKLEYRESVWRKHP